MPQYRAVTSAERNAFFEKMTAVATCLSSLTGKAWTSEPVDAPDTGDVHLLSGGQRSLHLAMNNDHYHTASQAGKYTACCVWPRRLSAFLGSSPDTRPGSIQISDKKDAAAIAKDLAKRMIPLYEEHIKELEERYKSTESLAGRVKAAAEKIEAASGGEWQFLGENLAEPDLSTAYRASYIRTKAGNLTLDVSSSSAQIKGYISHALAEKIAALILEENQTK